MSAGLPPMTPVKSSNLEAIGYRGTSLFVRFKGGGVYEYAGVPSDLYHEGLKADSPGSWFRNSVRSKFPAEKHGQPDDH